MALCEKCSVEVADGIDSCPNCGEQMVAEQPSSQQDAQVQNEYAQPYYQQPVYTEAPASGKMSVGLLIWSIMNTIFNCNILGIIALVFTIMAPNSQTLFEEKKKLKAILILNIIATVLNIISIVVFVILLINGTFAELANRGFSV